MEVLADRTARFDAAFARTNDPLAVRAGDLVVALRELTDEAVDAFDESENRDLRESLYGALAPVLDNRYSQHLHTLRWVRATHGAETTADQREALSDLETVLEDVNLARHYLKTLYTHAELSTLTHLMLLTGVPAFLVAVTVILAYGNGTPAVPGPYLTVVVSLVFAVTAVPLSVLASYVLRIIAVAKRTTTYGAFVPAEELP